MPTARNGFAAVATGNGKLYAIGGSDGNNYVSTCAEYDPATNSWATKAAMPTARYLLAGAAPGNGKLYAIGGITTGGTNPFAIATCEEYDPSANTWTAKAPMNTARYGFAAVAPGNGKLYVMGGHSSGNVYGSCEEYDPNTNTWTFKASMTTSVINFAATAPGNGKIYAFGGDNFTTGIATCEEYDPSANIWTAKASMNTPRRYLAAAAPGNGKVYALGGMQGTGVFLATCEEYDPDANTWIAKASMPVGTALLAAAAPGNQKLYVMGGWNAVASVNATCLEYTPSGGSGVAKNEVAADRFALSVSPNPARNAVTLHATLARTAEAHVEILDNTGHVLLIQPLSALSEGSHDVVLSMANLASGTYFVRVICANGGHAETRIVVER
jgi:hypothetical protein